MSALAEALVAAQAELPLSLRRDADGQIGERGYRYVTFDALVEATRPILNRHGLAIVQDVTGERELATTLHHESGEHLCCGFLPLLLPTETMQGLGAAITYARRYAWAAALGIASEEDDDASSVSQAAGAAHAPPEASEAQWGRIRRDCREKGVQEPDGPLTKAEASDVIGQLGAGTYDPAKWSVPF